MVRLYFETDIHQTKLHMYTSMTQRNPLSFITNMLWYKTLTLLIIFSQQLLSARIQYVFQVSMRREVKKLFIKYLNIKAYISICFIPYDHKMMLVMLSRTLLPSHSTT